MKIPDTFVADLRTRVPLVDVIGDYVDLKPEGADRYVGLCPFHNERTPSFKVRSDYQRFRCFGCGEAGDAIDFLRQVDGLDFRQAIEQLAAKAGLPVPDGPADDDTRNRQQRIKTVLAEAHDLFQQWLIGAGAQPARTYLDDRAFTVDHRRDWELGYNPPGNQLLTELAARGHDRSLLVDAGLVKQSQRGTWYDTFAGRLIWPLHNKSGQLVAFAGRALDDNARAKFINSEDSDLFHKRDTLFGLWRARKDILARREAIIVEGYTDVMALHSAGHPNAVASCGTAITPAHAELLAGRVGDQGRIVSGFDHDAAGREATWSLVLACQHFTTQISALDYSDYGTKADACDVRRRDGDSGLAAIVARQIPALQLLVDADTYLTDPTPEHTALAAHRVTERLNHLTSPILRRRYLEYAAGRLDVPVTYLTDGAHIPPPPPAVTPAPVLLDDDVNTIAATLIDYPHLIFDFTDDPTNLDDLFGDPVAAHIAVLSYAGYPDGRPHSGEDSETWGEFMREVIDAEHHDRLWTIAFTAPAPHQVHDLVNRQQRTRLAQIIAATRNDPARADEYLAAHQALRDLRTAGTGQ